MLKYKMDLDKVCNFYYICAHLYESEDELNTWLSLKNNFISKYTAVR